MSTVPLWITTEPHGVILHIQVQPRASRSEVYGLIQDRLKIRIAAPPVDGEANDELFRFLSKLLGVPKSRLQLLRGESSKMKDLRIEGITLEFLRQKLDKETLWPK